MKYLALDIGNVICDVDFSSFLRTLSKTQNIHLDDALYFLVRTQKIHDVGLVQIADELKDRFKIKSNIVLDELMAEWNNTVKINPTVKDFFLKKLKENIKIALLSNVGFEHAAIMQNILGTDIYKNCIKFFSCDVGVRKPTSLYYKTFLDMHPEFKGCVYVDDRRENLDAGLEFGFKTCSLALDACKSKSEIKAFLDSIETIL